MKEIKMFLFYLRLTGPHLLFLLLNCPALSYVHTALYSKGHLPSANRRGSLSGSGGKACVPPALYPCDPHCRMLLKLAQAFSTWDRAVRSRGTCHSQSPPHPSCDPAGEDCCCNRSTNKQRTDPSTHTFSSGDTRKHARSSHSNICL